MVANRLAARGQDWGQVFSRYNSGTYNNQVIHTSVTFTTPTLPSGWWCQALGPCG